MEKVKKRYAKRLTNPKKLAAVKEAVAKIVVKPATMKRSSKAKASISPEKIQQFIQKKAYEVYMSRGCINGRDTENWLEAERLVKMELGLA